MSDHAVRLTRTNVQVMRGVRDHGDSHWSASGLQQHGGFTTSVRSLVRRGLLAYDDDWRLVITDAGRGALAAAESRRG